MYLPRNLLSHLYNHLLRSHHPLSPPVLILAALEPDALCACRILTTLLKRDYIPHKIQPVSGYGDLTRAGEELVRPMRLSEGGSGGIVVCMGVGGLVDLEENLGLEGEDNGLGDTSGVEVWVIDARRPWNLGNVFGSEPQTGQELESSVGAGRNKSNRGVENGRIRQSYVPGKGGIIVFDDGDIDEQLSAERDAYCGLASMPEVDDDGAESDGSGSDDNEHEDSAQHTKKRKSWSAFDDESDSEREDERPRQRRRSNSVSWNLGTAAVISIVLTLASRVVPYRPLQHDLKEAPLPTPFPPLRILRQQQYQNPRRVHCVAVYFD